MDFDIEEQVLGTLLLKPELMPKVLIPEECFFDPVNKFIFKIIKKQYSDEKTIDIIGIKNKYKYLFNDNFKEKEIINKMFGLFTDTLPTRFDYYQELLFSRLIDYKIIRAIDHFHKNKISKEEMLEDIHKFEMMSISTEENKLSYEEIFRLINSKNKNISFRFDKLSKYANIQEHDLVVVAARPGIGKTGFLLNLIEDLSDRYNCLLFNLEMSEKQVYQRLVGINTKIPIIYHDNPETDYQKEKIKDGAKAISKKKIKVISSSQTINSIKRKIINESKGNHLIVFIDYVGLITGERGQTSYERVTSIVKELRQISLDYDCTIFLASQINRNSEKEKDKRPKISDLKESGELEQSATTVLMLHNENYYKDIEMKIEEIQVIIGKNRNGQTGIIDLNYDQQRQRFENFTRKQINNNDWRNKNE